MTRRAFDVAITSSSDLRKAGGSVGSMALPSTDVEDECASETGGSRPMDATQEGERASLAPRVAQNLMQTRDADCCSGTPCPRCCRDSPRPAQRSA